MASRDLEFALKFRNEAKATIKQVQSDLLALGKTAGQVATEVKKFSTNTTQLDTALLRNVQALTKAELATKRMEIQEARLAVQSQQLSMAQERLALGQQKLALATERAALAQQKFDAQQAKSTKGFMGMTGAVGNLARQFLPLNIAISTFFGLRMADEFVLQEARIRNATQSVKEFEQSFNGLRDISRETGTGMEATVSIFQRLSFVRKEIGATTDEMLQFTETVSKLGVISGASPDALKFGLTQLGQGLSSNILRAEEFNSIMENIPAVGKQIADEFGVMQGQLRQLAINGKVLSADVFAALLNATEKVRAEFDKFPETVGRAWQGFLLDLGFAINGINQTSNASKLLIEVLFRAGKLIGALADLTVGFIGIFKTLFSGLVGGIIDAALTASEWLENLANIGIKAINKLRSEDNKISLVDFVDAESFDQAWKEDMRKQAVEAGDAFKSAFDNTGGVLLGETYSKITKEAENNAVATRMLSQDYAALAATMADTDKKAASFYSNLAEQIETLKAEAFWVDKSAKARERAMLATKAQQDALKAGIKNFDPTELLAAYDALEAAKDRVSNDFGTGLRVAMQSFVDEAKGAGDLAQDVFKRMASGISDTIKGLVTGSINNFEDLRSAIGNILADLAGMFAEFAVQQAAMSAIKSLGSASGGGGGFMSFVQTLFNANGNAFNNGKRITAFAKGGIVDSPTAFPMSNGAGVMGEAGPEAIVPLQRMANGKLGVGASVGGNNMTLNYQPTFMLEFNSEGGGGQSNGMMNPEFIKMMDGEMRKTASDVIQRELRPGGMLGGGRGRSS